MDDSASSAVALLANAEDDDEAYDATDMKASGRVPDASRGDTNTRPANSWRPNNAAVRQAPSASSAK